MIFETCNNIERHRYLYHFVLVLQYGKACNLTRECNERTSLICSDKHKKCFCDPSYAYAHEKKCLSRKFP